MPRPADLTVTHHTSADAATLMDELCEVYADAYGAVSGEDVGERHCSQYEKTLAVLSSSGHRRFHSSAARRWLQPWA